MENLLDRANGILDEIVEIRRDIHSHPELGGEEVRTSGLIRDRLEKYRVDSIESLTPTSVVATIKGNKGDGRCVALRADIDALPVQENTGAPFSSQTEGVMHACGHDMHCSMMLGTAKLLCGLRDEFAGTVKLIFEHSEEHFPGGARELIDKGVMDGVDAVFGMHVFPTENDKTGVVGFKEGPFTTSADEYWYDISGPGGHGSLPHKAPDPILAAAEMILLFQKVQSRDVAPSDTAVFMMNSIHGGHAPNIIADKVRMGGNARAYTREAREKIKNNAFKVAEAVEHVSGCKIDVDAKMGYDACYNDPDLVEMLLNGLPKFVGEDHVERFSEPVSFSEDYSFYSTLTGVPSVFMILQAGHVGNLSTLHSADCLMEESAMPYGMAAMTGAALEFLNRQ